MEKRQAILVTGASTGIGRQCVLDLAALGYFVFAGVRQTYDAFPDGLVIHPVPLDVTDQQQLANAVSSVEAMLGDYSLNALAALVNNAGVAVGGPLEFISPEDLRYQFEVNVFGQISCTQVFLPLLRRFGAGAKIINMSSIAGRSYLPFASPYSASKHALEAFSDALRVELAPWGIKVCIIEPGVIQTPIWDKAASSLRQLKSRCPEQALQLYGCYLACFETHIGKCSNKGISPAVVSKAVIDAVRNPRPKHRYLLGNDARFRALLNLLPTSLLDRLMLSYFEKRLPK